jgi:hypothetical protein
MEKRYQVFVSSTFTDLKDERTRVIQTLMEMDCIPAGMELFPAADEEQWAFIKKIIDDCDYYLLIIGGRYGSTTAEGISYTEKEYDYAVSRNMKVLAFLHGKPDDIPAGKSELSPELRVKLETFRNTVSEKRLVSFWSTAGELPGLVALSLSKTIKTHPAIGWVRGNTIAGADVLGQINQLRLENEQLRRQIAESLPAPGVPIENIAGLDEKFPINGQSSTSGGVHKWTANDTWRQYFALVSPFLTKATLEGEMHRWLGRVIGDVKSPRGTNSSIEHQDFQTFTIQLKVLGLVRITPSADGRFVYWSLTPRGEQLMLEERVIRTKE